MERLLRKGSKDRNWFKPRKLKPSDKIKAFLLANPGATVSDYAKSMKTKVAQMQGEF